MKIASTLKCRAHPPCSAMTNRSRPGIMQTIEVTGHAVRSAVITMRRTRTPLEYVIFPMLHVASPTFNSQVRIRLRERDLIVIEGPELVVLRRA
ncbi:hypothetical protein [Streptomyces sp. NPDC056661]|uniref:hypothetical protein n=1 Tax=Streptomyces sp. NPDC056661 TaxID=3345898 RepID=UPI00368638D6